MKTKNTWPETRYIPEIKLWLVVTDYHFFFILNGVLYHGIVKAGFLYDKASVPWVGRAILDLAKSGKLDKMSTPHDAFYVLKGEVPIDSRILEIYKQGHRTALKITRNQADIIMRDMMMEDVPRLFTEKRVNFLYNMVVLGGWTKWIKKRKPETDFIHHDYKD
jgi:hypothetical protein